MRSAILLLTNYDVAVDKTNLISLPFSHPTCDRHDVKRFFFYSGVKGAILGVKNKK